MRSGISNLFIEHKEAGKEEPNLRKKNAENYVVRSSPSRFNDKHESATRGLIKLARFHCSTSKFTKNPLRV